MLLIQASFARLRVSGTQEERNQIVQNVNDGTECGRINSVDRTLIGSRVVHEDHFGTICYAGELPNSKGAWLGIDWDNPSRGRHDGVYAGVKYFETQSSTSGSFIRFVDGHPRFKPYYFHLEFTLLLHFDV